MYLGVMDMNQRVPCSCSVPPTLHPQEEERIARLHGYDILDTGPDVIFERLTRMAATLTGTPIALFSLVDRKRLWVKSSFGIELKECSREDSFCSHTILNAEKMMVIHDSLQDPRFRTNRFVTGEPHIRFYAGVPLHNGDHLPIGCFCVIDRQPRELTPGQIRSLEDLAGIAMDYLEVHRSKREISLLLRHEKQVYNHLLRLSSEMSTEAPTFESALGKITQHLDPDLGWISCRITNLINKGSSVIRTNPRLPADPEIDRLWREIDSHAGDRNQKLTRTEVITAGVARPEYIHLVIPIGVRGKNAALIEMIYPDYSLMDDRIKEVFDLMGANLGIIAERELINLDLQYRADHDALTGAVNRNLFLDELTKTIAGVDQLHPDSVLLFLDLDGFKEVNDNLSHQIGDRLLIEVTERLRGICREQDVLGRLSGDEFVLLMRNIHPDGDMEALLKRIQRCLTQPFMLGDLDIRIGCSIGAAVIDRRNLTSSEIIRRSEEAMYLVKSGERKGYCIADEKIVWQFKNRLNLDRRIHEAVFDRRLLLHFQPIIDLRTGELCGAEALLRVHERDGGILDAADFISSLERIRLMPDVDEWVFAEAVRLILLNLDVLSSIPEFRISLNVSPAILCTHGYAALSLGRIRSVGIPPTMLRIEIIENHLDTSNATLLQNINLLRSEGVKIAIDDFGTGYSNLQHLTSIPCDTLKIDRMFLKGKSSGDSGSNELLSAIVNLGKNLGYSLIAEGVENEAQVENLLSLGCTMGQGYLYGKPMPVEEFIAYARKHSPNQLQVRTLSLHS
jgi:diguanylate cyclase (GGDEF)-like protein